MLGVTFDANLKNLSDLNFVPKLEKLKSILRTWSLRDMTPIGKITIVKTLGRFQLIYLFSVLPKPKDDCLKELDISGLTSQIRLVVRHLLVTIKMVV